MGWTAAYRARTQTGLGYAARVGLEAPAGVLVARAAHQLRRHGPQFRHGRRWRRLGGVCGWVLAAGRLRLGQPGLATGVPPPALWLDSWVEVAWVFVYA